MKSNFDSFQSCIYTVVCFVPWWNIEKKRHILLLDFGLLSGCMHQPNVLLYIYVQCTWTQRRKYCIPFITFMISLDNWRALVQLLSLTHPTHTPTKERDEVQCKVLEILSWDLQIWSGLLQRWSVEFRCIGVFFLYHSKTKTHNKARYKEMILCWLSRIW